MNGTDTIDFKKAAVDLCVELTTVLAANAKISIEQDRTAFSLVEGRDKHSGAQPRKVDADNADVAQRWLARPDVQARAIEDVRMETEESQARIFNPENFRSLFLRVDELDGTSNAAATGMNWSTAAMAFVWAPAYRKHVLAGGAIALPDSHVVSFINRTRHFPDGTPQPIVATVELGLWDAFTTRSLGSTEQVEVRSLGEIPDPPYFGDPDFVLINAAAGTERVKIADRHPALLRDTRYRGLCAGTPIVYAAARGLTSMIIDPGKSTLHDSTHLFVLAALGWEILELETLTPINILAIAEANALRPGFERPIPPTVAVRNRDALRHLQATT